MQTQTVFKAGNSYVVSIPKHLAKELNIKSGQKVSVEKTSDSNGIIIKRETKKSSKESSADLEFKRWLKIALEEDKEILDELATR